MIGARRFAWNSALLRPDIFRAVALLSVPYLPRMPIRPSDAMKAIFGDKVLPAILPGGRQGRGGFGARPQNRVARPYVLALRRCSAVRAMALLVRSWRAPDGNGDGAEAVAAVAFRDRPRLFRQRISPHGLRRGAQLVPQYRPLLGADAVSRRRQARTADSLRCGRQGSRHRVLSRRVSVVGSQRAQP